MFGRAGRPQFDTQGFVFALAHEDDVKILRWREKYDQIPEDTKDPKLRKAKKALKKKMPKRRSSNSIGPKGNSTNCDPRHQAICTAEARSPGGCWPTCWTFHQKSNRFGNWSASG